MSASVCTETLCHFGNQLCKRRPVSGSQDHWHVIWPALRRIELRIGRKRSVHFKDRVKLRRGGISFHKMVHVARREFAKVEEVAEVVGLPARDKLLWEPRNLHKPDVPHCGMALNLIPALNSGKRHIENHHPACGLRITAN